MFSAISEPACDRRQVCSPQCSKNRTRPAELYDRKQDPQETQNVIEAQRGVADAMEHRLERFAKEMEKRLVESK